MNPTGEQERRAELNARWDLADERIAREIRERGSLPEGELSEDEIARIAVDITACGDGPASPPPGP